ncbi:HMG box-containing protein 4 isoform X1 [Astyanax mexicanus]|uniref:HMG box-containing protein 4-like isoform X1 n=2 Tax=Astyanax mexicanus TaxID=7994 RepID=A0A8T2M2Q9_ASTMX|nr:HMG box-containing protein 4 isoform X1 [Astyanax mexicanus]KAG9277494.1 HMG box-containing protein 4-like isoform X1 [Astyanax mexicanus]
MFFVSKRGNNKEFVVWLASGKMEGEVSLVAGRSQREKRRSYKDLLREQEIIDAEVRKSAKKRLKDAEGHLASTDSHKKKKKKHDEEDHHGKDHGSGSHHKKKKKPSESHGASMSSSNSSHTAMTAMGLLQAITSPTAVGSEPSPSFPKKPLYPSQHHLAKEKKRDSLGISKPTKKTPPPHQQQQRQPQQPQRQPPQQQRQLQPQRQPSQQQRQLQPQRQPPQRQSPQQQRQPQQQQHIVREALPVVGEEVELEGHYGGSYEFMDDDSSSSADDTDNGQLVIDDSLASHNKKSKKSKKSKKKKDKDRERRHSSKGTKKSTSNGSSEGALHPAARPGSHSDKKRKKEEKARLKAEKSKKKVLTAYQIFYKEYRLSILEEQPGLEFGDLSKKLADAWNQLPEGDKQVWRERAEYLQHKRMKSESSANKHSKHSQPKPAKDTSKNKGVSSFPGVASPTTGAASSVPKRVEPQVSPAQNGTGLVPITEVPPSPLRDPDVDPIDAAAHLQLLGESLSLIGRRLQETEGMVTVSGSLSVLLDSVLCALGPLACLTAQVPELNGCPPHVLSNTLDNIAYVMPGL